MAQETKQTQGQLPCTTGCGFYGNPRNDGMCSVCYKDFLQRQNSNGRASPQVSSATVSSIGESLLAQCSEGRTVDVPSATPHTDADTGHSSVAVSQSLSTHSGEETTTGAKVGLKTEELQGVSSAAAAAAAATAAVGSGQEESSTASSSGTRSHSQDRKSGRSPPPEEGSRRGKRKLDDHHEPDGERASVSVSEDSDQVSVDGLEDKSSDDKPKAKKNRCFTCRKKLGLTGFDCRCGNVFCGMHRYSDIHNCTFDYKADAAEKIRRENPVCVGEKIQKI